MLIGALRKKLNEEGVFNLDEHDLLFGENPLTNDNETAESVGIPSYYIGNNGYEARKVIAGFDLSYNVGTATTYLLRCGKKKEQGMSDKDKHIDDINKAINHLKFELERLNNE